MNYTEKGSRSYLFSIVLVAVLGGLLFGYDTAVISGAEKGLQAFFMGADDFIYTDTWHGITSSSALLGCIIGSALSGFFASRFGRKLSLLIAGIMFFLSALGSYYPEFLIFPFSRNMNKPPNISSPMSILSKGHKLFLEIKFTSPAP